MNRAVNTVSVIEVASEGSNNQSNNSNSPSEEVRVSNENASEAAVPNNVVTTSSNSRNSVASLVTAVHLYRENAAKQLSHQQAGGDLALIEKVEFKQKMKKILCCRICSELRRCPMFQCKYGHLICAGCLNDILSESRIQNEIATCPECQTTITKELCFRNVAVEKTISELPITCPYCLDEFPPTSFQHHQYAQCGKRPSQCSNIIIGCQWKGPEKERHAHERQCSQLTANGYEILKSLEPFDERLRSGHDMYNKIMELMSVEKVSYTDLQLKQVRIENNKNIVFETSKFSAFENQWMVRAYCHGDGKSICYQLSVKSKLISPMNLKYLILKGPYNDMDIRPNVDQFKFTEKSEESPYQNLEVPAATDKELFCRAKRINIRMFMFIVR